MSDDQEGFAGLPSDFWILMISLIISNVFILGFSPFIPYFLREVGAEAKEIGLVFTVSRVFYVALVPIGGFMADIFGRKKLLILGPAVTGVSYLVLSQANSWEDAILPLAFSMLPTAFTAPPIFAYIADVASRYRYGRAYGIYSACMNLSAVVGYIIMGIVIDRFGYEFSIFLVGSLTLVSGLTRIFLKETVKRRSDLSVRRQLVKSCIELRRPYILLLITTRSLYLAVAGVVVSIFIPLWARDFALMTEVDVSLIFAIEGTVYTVLAPIGGRLVEGKQWFWLSLVELLIRSGALIVLANSYNIIGVLAALLMDSGFAIFVIPSIEARISAELEKFHRGAGWGVQQAFMSIITMGAMYIGGLLWDEFGPANTLYIHIVYMVLLTGMLYLIANNEKQKGNV